MSAATSDLSQAIAGRYELLREIGRGGSATVYLARDRKHDRAVALKVLLPEIAEGLGAERFLREIQLLARLQHPHILPLFDSGEAGGVLYFVMPFVDGESLRSRLDAEGALTLGDCARVVRQLADALDYAHARGVVHRDLKPENVLIAHGQVLLSDFGIARIGSSEGSESLTGVGITVGTPAYMSPEQAAADPNVDARTDVYSLGCVIYEMLGGSAPFAGPTALAYIRQHLLMEPPPLVGRRTALPPEVVAHVARAMAKDPVDRFASAGALVEAIENAQAVQSRVTPLDAVATGSSHDQPVPHPILVLDFMNVSGAADIDWLATGIAETVSADLRKVSSVRLVGRVPGTRRRIEEKRAGRPLDDEVALDVGRLAGAAWVICGSYQKVGARLRITPSFASVRTGEVHSGPKLDGTMDEVFELQDRIVTSLSDLLRTSLTSGEVERIRLPETISLTAYEHYARGYRATLEMSKEGVRIAAEHFRAAIAIDPNYAPAFVGLGMLHGPMYIATGRDDLLDAGEAYLQRGLSLDPTIADGFAWLAYIQARRNRFVDAEAAARKGIELDPASYFCWYLLGGVRIAAAVAGHDLPRLTASVAPLLRTLTINPNYHPAVVLLVASYQLRGQYGHAQRLTERGLVLERAAAGLQFVGSVVQQAAIFVGQGNLDAAITPLDEAIARYENANHVYAEAMSAYAYWLRGIVDERRGAIIGARSAFEKACAIAEANPHRVSIGGHWVKAQLGLARLQWRQAMSADTTRESALAVFREKARFVWAHFIGASDAEILYEHAATLATIGHGDEAMTALRQAADAGWADLTWLHNDPAFTELKQDPRLRELGAEAARRLTLPAPVGSGGAD